MKKFVLCLLLLLIVGCANLDKDYVEADIKTYKAVVPDMVRSYQKINDPMVKWIKINTINTWTARIKEALEHPDLAELRHLFSPIFIELDLEDLLDPLPPIEPGGDNGGN